MASGQTIDVDALLKPIEGAHPAGKDVSQGKSVAQLKEARREDDPTLQGEWRREIKTAEWPKVVRIATEILRTESKDLRVAVWLVEGLVKQRGFAGLRDGLRVLRGLHEQYWPSMFPVIEDGDVEYRSGWIEALTHKTLPVALRVVPIVTRQDGVQFGYCHYEESIWIEKLRRGGAPTEKALDEELAEGKIDRETFVKAMTAVPLRYCTTLSEDLIECREELKQFDGILREKYEDCAPSLYRVNSVIEDCSIMIDGFVEEKTGHKLNIAG